jgi:hypothetical protein
LQDVVIHKEVQMFWVAQTRAKSLTRMLVLAASVIVLVLAFAPASFAGEDNSCSDNNSCNNSGGSDTGSASGGAQTGVGGVVAPTNGSMAIPFALATGGVLFLTAAGGLATRRRASE